MSSGSVVHNYRRGREGMTGPKVFDDWDHQSDFEDIARARSGDAGAVERDEVVDV